MSAPPRSRKGKKKVVIEDDPIEFSDDMYDMDNPVTETDIPYPAAQTRAYSSNVVVSAIKLDATGTLKPPSRSASDPVEILYGKMLALRKEVYHSTHPPDFLF